MPGCSDRNLAEIPPLKPAGSRDEGDRISRGLRSLRVRGRLSGRTPSPMFRSKLPGTPLSGARALTIPNDSKGFIDELLEMIYKNAR